MDATNFWALVTNRSGGYVVNDSGNNDHYCSTNTEAEETEEVYLTPDLE